MIGGALLALLLGVALAAGWKADGGRRVLFPLVLLYAALAYGVMLAFLTSVIPFSEGGDDRSYWLASQVRLRSLAAWLDFNQFHDFAQGGYPLLLAWVYQVSGPSLFVLKAVNVFFYLLLAVLWFRMGAELGGRRTAYAFALAVLLGTPLWTYWIFLLKDMSIVLLQSLFLLGAVRLGRGRGGPRSWVPMAVSTVLLIPFRIYLVLLHAGVVVATVVLAGKRSPVRKAALLLLATALLGGLALLGGSREALNAFGARGQDRTLNYETLRGVSEKYAEDRSKYSGPVGLVAFPLAYVFGETSGLRVGAGEPASRGASQPEVVVGGLSALPWIFLGAPLFLYALWIFFLRRLPRRFRPARRASAWVRVPEPRPALAMAGAPGTAHRPAAVLRPAPAARPSPVEAGGDLLDRGWLPLFVFLVLYAVMAWLVEDTTRWRMPAFPVMAALAAQGWIWLKPRARTLLVGGWATTLAVLFTLYYGVLK